MPLPLNTPANAGLDWNTIRGNLPGSRGASGYATMADYLADKQGTLQGWKPTWDASQLTPPVGDQGANAGIWANPLHNGGGGVDTTLGGMRKGIGGAVAPVAAPKVGANGAQAFSADPGLSGINNANSDAGQYQWPTFGSGSGASGAGGMTAGGPGFNEANGNYTAGMTPQDYINPAADWARGEGLKALQSSYAGAGDFLSGHAMKGISDYATNSALNQAWQPGFQNYMQDKNFNYGVDTGDRNFNYQAALNDQTIPFDQQMRLGQLGLQGAGIGANQNNMLAALLSQNLMGGANAGAAGTMGQSNSINNAISQMLQQYLGNNKIYPQGG